MKNARNVFPFLAFPLDLPQHFKMFGDKVRLRQLYDAIGCERLPKQRLVGVQ